MKKQILILLLSLATTSVAHAGQGPLESLYNFQLQMANNGSTLAMMELGKMYEQGTGTKQNLDKALEMYRRAKAGGQANADTAIARVIRLKKTLAEAARLKQQQLIQQKQRTQQQKQRAEQQKQAEAKHQAQLQREAKARAARDAKERAHQQALARQRARLARLRDAQAKANAERAALAREKAAAAAQELARQRAAQRQKAVATGKQQTPVEKKLNTKKKKDTFKSNPCNTAAASLMSLCH